MVSSVAACAYSLATAYAYCALSMGMTQQFFVFFVPVTLTFDLHLQTRARFCTTYLPAKFDRPMFSRSEVIVRTNKLTNKQTPLKTSTSLRYATPVDNHHQLVRSARRNTSEPGWWFGSMVTALIASTKLLDVEPG